MAYAITHRTGIEAFLPGVSLTKALEGGVIAGLLGGCFVAFWSMASAAYAGYGAHFAFNLVGATFEGPEALVGGAGAAFWGLSVHLTVSIIFGILYAFMVRPEVQNMTSLFGGVVYGMAILALMTYVVLPWANPVLHQRVWMMPTSWFFTHALFGLGVASVPMLERHLGEQSPPARANPAPTV
jgi:hypothetical protein